MSGKFYEEFELNEVQKTQGRTVTEADIVNFCGFTGDWAELHTNAEYAKSTPFGKRIAHGMLTLSAATGLAIQTGTLRETIVAFESIKEWEFKRPVFIGDTVVVEMQAVEKKTRKLRGGLEVGQVLMKVEVKNQSGKVCQSGQWSFLVKIKANEPAAVTAN